MGLETLQRAEGLREIGPFGLWIHIGYSLVAQVVQLSWKLLDILMIVAATVIEVDSVEMKTHSVLIGSKVSHVAF